MPKYDRGSNPPAAIAIVKISNVDTGVARDDIAMLLDTGAEISALPARLVKELGIAPYKRYQIAGYSGQEQSLDAQESLSLDMDWKASS